MNASIAGISYYLPERIITNAELVEDFPHLSDEIIYRRTGVRQRHCAINNDPYLDPKPSDLGYLSALKLLDEYDIDVKTVDFVIFVSEGLDYKAPATACTLQERLGVSSDAGAIDIPHGCTGFIYGLSVAKGLIASGQAKSILLIVAEAPSYVIHKDDYELRMLFGDGAASILLKAMADTNIGIGKFVFGTDGAGINNLRVRGTSMKEPIDKEWLDSYSDNFGMVYGKMEMNGPEIFIFALKRVPGMIHDLLQKENLRLEDIDLFIFHQANGFLLNVLRKKLKIPEEKFMVYIENVGNTVSASIPIAMKEAIKAGKIKSGDTILLAGFGIGYSWAATIIRM